VALTELDRNLVQHCLHHTPGAWQDFVDRFIGLFVHVIRHTAHARSVVLGADDIDDLCSEVFMTLLKDDFSVLRNFRGESSLATYLTVVARRIVVHEIVRRRRSEALGHVDVHQATMDAAASTRSDIERIEDAEEVEIMLRGLSAQDAAVVRQFHLEGKSYREISGSLGIPENTIGPTLTRARSRLRDLRLKTGV
jgi:RNA polymerase sigma-70 factor (ECF subfamily)